MTPFDWLSPPPQRCHARAPAPIAGRRFSYYPAMRAVAMTLDGRLNGQCPSVGDVSAVEAGKFQLRAEHRDTARAVSSKPPGAQPCALVALTGTGHSKVSHRWSSCRADAASPSRATAGVAERLFLSLQGYKGWLGRTEEETRRLATLIRAQLPATTRTGTTVGAVTDRAVRLDHPQRPFDYVALV